MISPLNTDGEPERFWAALRSGETAVREIRSFDASVYACRVAAEIPREVLSCEDPWVDPAIRMARIAFDRALRDARFIPGDYAPGRAGIVVGTVLGGILSGERYMR